MLGLGLHLGPLGSPAQSVFKPQYTFHGAGQSLMDHIFLVGTPIVAANWGALLRTGLGLTAVRGFTKWNSGASVSDGTTATSSDYTIQLRNFAGSGSALMDVAGSSELNPATSSTGFVNVWWNTQDNSAVTGDPTDLANTPCRLWKRLIADIAAHPTDGICWSQGQTDENWINLSPANRALYKATLEALIAATRTASGNPNLPFFIHRVGRHEGSFGDNNGYQNLRDLQFEITQEVSNVHITADEYNAKMGEALSITSCTTDGTTGVVLTANTTGLVVGYRISGPGVQDGSFVTALSAGVSFTLSKNTTVSASGVTLSGGDVVHLYPKGSPLDSNGNTTHDGVSGYYDVTRRAVRGMIRALQLGASSQASYGPRFTHLAAQEGTNYADLTVSQDQGSTLTTPNGAISAVCAPLFRAVNNSTPLTTTNVQLTTPTNIRLTFSSTLVDGTLSVTPLYGELCQFDYKNFIVDDAPLPTPLQPTSPTIDAAMSITVALGLPGNTVAPAVTGTLTVGSTLTCSAGTWIESPTSYSYQWRRDGTNIGGATANTYVIVSGDNAHNLDCIVTATNAAGSVTAASNAVTPTSAYVNSVQPVSITIPSGSTSATATISTVGTGAFLVYQGQTETDSSPTDFTNEIATVTLTNSTTITAIRNSAGTSQTVTVNVAVVDATANLVDSVQFGTVAVTGGTSGTATISSVDTSRSAVFYLGSKTTIASGASRIFGGLTLTNSTTVTGNLGTTPGASTVTLAFCVVQFNASAIQSVQQRATLSNSLSTTEALTISAVTMANTMLAFGGVTSATSTFNAFLSYQQLSSTTNVNSVRNTSSASDHTPYFTAIEFRSGVLASVQRGAITVNSVTSNTATITGVGSKAIVNYTGLATNATAPNEMFSKLALTNSTTITASKNTAGTSQSVVGFEAVEFN